jgi:Putative Ig domain
MNNSHTSSHRSPAHLRMLSLLTTSNLLACLGAALVAGCGGGGGGASAGDNGGGEPPQSNTAPMISGKPQTSVNAGSDYSFTPTAEDPDGDRLTFAIANAPFWAAFDETTGNLSGTPLSSQLGDYNDIVISVSDGKASAQLPGFSLVVSPQKLGTSNITTEGDVFPTENGYHTVGDVVLNTGERVQRFEDADLLIEFDGQGFLVEFAGETMLPAKLSDNVTVASPVRALVGLMTGAEINADEAFGITLQETTNYFVFFLSASVDLTIEDRDNPGAFESVTLELPAAGELIVILDPTDPFLYRFGSQPLVGAYGFGESENGLVPFVPDLDHPELDSFSGHQIDKGAMDVGVKIFDFFTISGMRVIKNPQFRDIDWNAPLNSTIEYRAGMNGNADFAFSILGVGLFSFDGAAVSATIDVGLDRQSMAMQALIAPDVSWVPEWFPFVPATEVSADWFINGDGEFSAKLAGSYASTVPAAVIAGTMEVDNDGSVLTGTVGDDAGEFDVSAEFRNDVTTVRVGFQEDFNTAINGHVLAAVDQQIAAAEQALAALETAVADYEFELSLRGLRVLLPGVADASIAILNNVPDLVRDAADAAAVDYIRNACVTVIFRVCLKDLVDETAIGDQIGATARAQAATEAAPYIDLMQDLKQQALAGDSDALRTALRESLLTAYGNRVFSRTFGIGFTFPDPFGRVSVYNETFTRRIIPEDTAEDILFAANNVHRIAETSNIMISAQAIFDAFPSEQIFDFIRQQVSDGLAQIPVLQGMGASISGGSVSAFVTFDDTDHPVGFNVLSPSEAIPGVADMIADQLLAEAE